MNIYQRINEVRKDVAYIQKDSKVQGYKAVTHDQVTGKIRQSLIKHGIVVVPSLVDSVMVVTGTATGKGTPWMRYEGRYSVRFVNVDEPTEFVESVIESHAMDTDDKAPGKAISYATKYAMLKLFSLETGEDDESRRQDIKVETITDEQEATLSALIEEVGADSGMFLRFLRVSNLLDLPAKRYGDAVAALEKKRG